MRHKIAIQEKIERLESKIKKTGYYINKTELGNAYDEIQKLLDIIEDMRTLLNNETQD